MEIYEPGEWVEWYAFDGHHYGAHAHADGRIWSFQGQHLDDCRCSNPEEWY